MTPCPTFKIWYLTPASLIHCSTASRITSSVPNRIIGSTLPCKCSISMACLWVPASRQKHRQTQFSQHVLQTLVLNFTSILTKRKRQTYKRCFPANRAKFKLGSPCSQCQTCCALQSFGQESLCSSVHQGSHITWRTALSPNNDLAWCISVAQSRPTTTSWWWRWAIMCSLPVPPFAWKIKGISGRCALTLLMTCST